MRLKSAPWLALGLLLLAMPAHGADAVPCDLEHPSGAPGCRRAELDRTLRLNDLQAAGSHNSYKQAIPPGEMALLASVAPDTAKTLDYGHPPLSTELDQGARQLEIDLLYDPKGGRYADPMIRRFAGPKAGPYDAESMRGPGLKVLHVQDVDFRSSCPLFTGCLKQIAAWSRAHPGHLPILILINLKEDALPTPGTVKPLLFDAAGMDSVDAEIRSVFGPGALITPDGVQGRHATLREAVLAGGWPTLGKARDHVLFALDAPPEQVARYRGARRSLEGRAMFVNIEETSPAAAYITLNEPIELSDQIRRDVAAGFLVRTRADADTVEARSGDTRRRDTAFAGGAQYVSTDYLRPDPRFGPYSVSLPGGGVARRSPAR